MRFFNDSLFSFYRIVTKHSNVLLQFTTGITIHDSTNQPILANGRYPCRFPGCDSSFKYGGFHRMSHQMLHQPPPPPPPPTTTKIPNPKMMSLITTVALCTWLYLREISDAIKEGDGERTVKCIKMFLPHFKQGGSGSTKYA